MASDGKVIIETELDGSGIKAGAKELAQGLKDALNSIEGMGSKSKQSAESSILAFKKSADAVEKQKAKVKALETELERLNWSNVKTPEFSGVENEINSLEKKLNSLLDKQERFLFIGGKENSPVYKRMEYDIDQVYMALERAEKEKERLLSNNQAYTAPDRSGVEIKLASETQKLAQMQETLGLKYQQTSTKIKDYAQKTMEANKADISGESTKRRLSSAMSRVGAVALATGSKFKGLLNTLFKLSTGANRAGEGFKNLFRKIIGYGFGISTVVMLFNKLRSAMMEGLNNLVFFDKATNQAISNITSALATLKNALATAFAPILQVIAPIITSFINMMTDAVNAIAMFVSALTGKSTYTRAVAQNKNYAASLKNSSGSTKQNAEDTRDNTDAIEDYGDAVEEAEKQLYSFDTLQKASDTTTQSMKDNFDDIADAIPDIGDIGGGGGGGGAGQMFETAEIDSAIQAFADKIKGLIDKIKELIKAGEFENLGKFFADILNDILAKLHQWLPQIDKYISSFVSKVIRTINGLLSELNFHLLGQVIGDGINIIIHALQTAVSEFQWGWAGKAFGQTVSGIVNEVDWKALGDTLYKSASGVFEMIRFAIRDIDWAGMTNGLVIGFVQMLQDFADNISRNGVAQGIAGTIGDTVVKPIAEAMDGLIGALEGIDINELLRLAPSDVASIASDYYHAGLLTFDQYAQALQECKTRTDFEQMFVADEANMTRWGTSSAEAYMNAYSIGLIGYGGVVTSTFDMTMDELLTIAKETGSLTWEEYENAVNGNMNFEQILSTMETAWQGTTEFANTYGAETAWDYANAVSLGIIENGNYMSDSVERTWGEPSYLQRIVESGMLAGTEYIGGYHKGATESIEPAKADVLESITSPSTEPVAMAGQDVGGTFGENVTTGMESTVNTDTVNATLARTFENVDMSTPGTTAGNSFADAFLAQLNVRTPDIRTAVSGMIDTNFLATTFDSVTISLQTLTSTFTNFSEVLTLWMTTFQEQWRFFSEPITLWIQNLPLLIQTSWETLSTYLMDEAWPTFLEDELENFWEPLVEAWEENLQALNDLWLVESLPALTEGLKTGFNGILTVMQAFVNGMIGGVNGIIDAINSIKVEIPAEIAELAGIPAISWSPNLKHASGYSIPMLATGAVIPPNAPFMAMLGDQKNGTNIEAPEALIRKIMREEMSSMGGGDINIEFTGNLSQLGRVLEPVIRRESNRKGTSLTNGVY